MPRIAGLLLATGLAAGGLGTAAGRPLELDCLDRFDLQQYTIGCWSMPPRGVAPDEAYWRTMRGDGFNAVLGVEPAPINRANDLEPVLGIMRAHPDRDDFPADLLHSLGVRVMLIAIFERVPEIAKRHEKIGWHPAVMGYQLSDNCYLHDITSDAACSDEPLDADQLWMATEPIRACRSRL